MRILYGVVGEGMGHAVRSRVVIEDLHARGHELQVMASGRAVGYLARHFDAVNGIVGLHLVARDNRVCKGRTIWSNLRRGATGIPHNIRAYFRLVDHFRPDVVVTDFDSWTHLYAQVHRLPVFSLDNIQLIPRCQHPAAVIDGRRAAYEFTRRFIAGKMAKCDHYLVSTSFARPPRRPKTTVVPPILRPEVERIPRHTGEHLLVYQTFPGYDSLVQALRATNIECRVYGFRPVTSGEERDGNLRHRPFSESQFLADLASARAVIGPGGSTFMSEAIYLRKPMLAVPLAGHFEQEINARYLQWFGWGEATAAIDQAGLMAFLERSEGYRMALETADGRGNEHALAALRRLVEGHGSLQDSCMAAG